MVKQKKDNPTVVVVGLGYVGLPLALAFGRVMPTYGYDVCQDKIAAYQQQSDPCLEVDKSTFEAAAQIQYSSDPDIIAHGDYIIIAVPTPIDQANQPDLTLTLKATATVASHLKRGAVVIFESTVYPGVTEDECIPMLEQVSGLCCGEDFKVGYSPERINPGDKVHTLEKIVKVVSAQDEETLERVAWLYEQIIEAGVHRAPSIKVAETAKVIENVQRDVNIALINELALICQRVGIDTHDVLDAAGSKWNFLPFKPGLVGGHCIGVDPYYLVQKAERLGYHPDVIMAGRRLNQGMGQFVADATIKQLAKSGKPVHGAHMLLMGLTFKEDCGDLRNTRVIDVIEVLQEYGVSLSIWDPVADREEAKAIFGLELITSIDEVNQLDGVIAAVAHREIVNLDLAQLVAKMREMPAPFIDVKAIYSRDKLKELGFKVWRL